MASSDHLNPGEKGKITAKVGIKSRSGRLSKSIKVFSNDPKRPVVTLFLKVIIR
jgi:hypothetical protein